MLILRSASRYGSNLYSCGQREEVVQKPTREEIPTVEVRDRIKLSRSVMKFCHLTRGFSLSSNRKETKE